MELGGQPSKVKDNTAQGLGDSNIGYPTNQDSSSGYNDQPNNHYIRRHKTFAILKGRLSALAQIGEDWMYLASLGAIMAMISFSMDGVINLLLENRLWLFRDLNDALIIQYFGWCVPPIILVAFSTGFVHLCSPTVGSDQQTL